MTDTSFNETQYENKPNKHFRVRLFATYFMLILIFIAMSLLGFQHRSIWFFSQIVGVVFGITCIGLHWYLYRNITKTKPTSVWHQLLHWIGLWVMLYMISILITTGFITSIQAGIFNLMLIALSVFIAGVYTDPSLLIVGIATATTTTYSTISPSHIFFKITPIILIAAILIFLLLYQQRHRAKKIKGN